MLDKEKVRLMTELAFYEQTQGKEDFKIDEYYQNDYAGFHTICSVIWITIGYVCVVGVIGFAAMDWILTNISRNLIIMLGMTALIAYLVIIVLYAFISNYIFERKHKASRERVKVFHYKLTRLLKMYEKEKK